MSIQGFVSGLEEQGAHFALEGDELVVKAPEILLTLEMAQLLREEKTAIIEFITQERPRINEVIDWARKMSRENRMASMPVRFTSNPLTETSTLNIGHSASEHLRYISLCRNRLNSGKTEGWISDWFESRMSESIEALRALREAYEAQERKDD